MLLWPGLRGVNGDCVTTHVGCRCWIVVEKRLLQGNLGLRGVAVGWELVYF